MTGVLSEGMPSRSLVISAIDHYPKHALPGAYLAVATPLVACVQDQVLAITVRVFSVSLCLCGERKSPFNLTSAPNTG